MQALELDTQCCSPMSQIVGLDTKQKSIPILKANKNPKLSTVHKRTAGPFYFLQGSVYLL